MPDTSKHLEKQRELCAQFRGWEVRHHPRPDLHPGPIDSQIIDPKKPGHLLMWLSDYHPDLDGLASLVQQRGLKSRLEELGYSYAIYSPLCPSIGGIWYTSKTFTCRIYGLKPGHEKEKEVSAYRWEIVRIGTGKSEGSALVSAVAQMQGEGGG